MNDLARNVLIGLVQRYGQELADDPRRCKALLNDLSGEHRLEVNLLVAAHEAGIPNALRNASRALPRQALISQQSQRLHEDRGIDLKYALWAVVSWALALGVISPSDLRTIGDIPSGGASASDGGRSGAGGRAAHVPGQRVIVPEGSPQQPISSLGDLWANAFRPELWIWFRELGGDLRRVGLLGVHNVRVFRGVARAVVEFHPVSFLSAARRAILGAIAGTLWLGLAGALGGLFAGILTIGLASAAQTFSLVYSVPILPSLREFVFWGAAYLGAGGAVYGALAQAYREFGDPGGAVLGTAGGVGLGWVVERQLGTDWTTGLVIGAAIGAVFGVVLLGIALQSQKKTLDYVGQALWAALRRLGHLRGWANLLARTINGAVFALLIWLILVQLFSEALLAAEVTGALVGFTAGAIGVNKI